MKRCLHQIEGPKMGRLIAWRRKCKRPVREGERYCWQHKSEHRA